MHTQDWEETLTSCRCRGGEDAFSSSQINHPRPKQGEEALCSSSDPRAHFVISGLRVYCKSTGYEKPCWFSPGMQNQMGLQLERLARGVSTKRSDWNADPGRARGNQACRLREQRRDSLPAKRLLQTPFPPTQGRAHLRAWTDVSTSWAPGVSAKAPAPQAVARRGRPACAAEWPRVEQSWWLFVNPQSPSWSPSWSPS